MDTVINEKALQEINSTKQYLLEYTDIDTSYEEMEVLFNTCYRLWQVGLTKANRDKAASFDYIENKAFNGCGIFTVLLALKMGIWDKNNVNHCVDLRWNGEEFILINSEGDEFSLKDEGKTWVGDNRWNCIKEVE